MAEPVRYTPTGEELVVIDPEAAKWGTIPCTSGMEIEQDYDDVRRCRRIMEEYEWHFDGSGPYETPLPPSIAPYREVKRFISLVLEDDCCWEWKGYYDYTSCGSHIHLRPRPSALHKRANPDVPGIEGDPEYDHPPHVAYEDVWATTYNTLVEVYPWILPLFAAGGPEVMRFRPRVTHWAQFNDDRVSPGRMRERYLSPGYFGHPYLAVALDRKTEAHILTIELRLNENHPAISYVAILILNRIIRRVYERGYISPKLALDPYRRGQLYRELEEAVARSALDDTDLYEELEATVRRFVDRYGPIRFEPGREIPRVKSEFRSYFEIFHSIIHYYTDWRSPVEYRVYKLYAARGNPRRNWKELWHLMHKPAKEFCWREPPICGL